MNNKKFYLLTVPALLLIFTFVFYPFVRGVYLSMTNWNGFSQEFDFIGLRNYISLLADKRTLIALRNTVLLASGDVTIQIILGLLYAMLMNKKFRGNNLSRVIIYLPVMVSSLIMGYVWYFLLQYGGALNDIMQLFGREPVDWLVYPKYSIGFLIVITAMQFVGQSMVIFLAGLKGIPNDMFEAAAIDGANTFRTIWHITLPFLRPAFASVFTIKLIGGLQVYDLIIALTNGGPGFQTHSVSTMINYHYFVSQNAGYAISMGIILFIMIFVLTMSFNAVIRRKRLN